MEEKKLDLDAPFLSVRRNTTKLENPNQLDNTKNKKTMKMKRRKVKETENETLVRLLQDDRGFDHVTEPSLVPFDWEQTPGKPKDYHSLIEELDLIKAFDMVSSTASFSVNCSSSGATDEFEKNEDISNHVTKDHDLIIEYHDLIMSRFLPAAKAIALKQKEESSPNQKKNKNIKKRNIALERVSIAINQDLNNDDDDGGGIATTVLSNISKKAEIGFLPKFCSKNSMDVFNPVISRVKTCQDLGVLSSRNAVNQKSIVSAYKTKSASLPRILRSNKVMISNNPQEIYLKPRFSKEISENPLLKNGEIARVPWNHSRLQQAASAQIQRQVTKLLVEEVNRRRNGDKMRSRTLSKTSSNSDYQPPLPKTPTESWLCRTLPRSSAASMVSGQEDGFKKTNSQPIKWETIVKTSYKHHDHVRYSEELIVHPSRQHKL